MPRKEEKEENNAYLFTSERGSQEVNTVCVMLWSFVAHGNSRRSHSPSSSSFFVSFLLSPSSRTHTHTHTYLQNSREISPWRKSFLIISQNTPLHFLKNISFISCHAPIHIVFLKLSYNNPKSKVWNKPGLSRDNSQNNSWERQHSTLLRAKMVKLRMNTNEECMIIRCNVANKCFFLCIVLTKKGCSYFIILVKKTLETIQWQVTWGKKVS